MRQDLIASAVKFLQDPKVQEAPLAKRISFLESKGLSSEEIKQALATQAGAPPVPPPNYPSGLVVSTQHRPDPWGWKDYTIGLVGLAGTGYGLFQLFHVSFFTSNNHL